MKKLSKNENLIITKPDKGNGVVVLDKCSYIGKMETILSDNTKFKPVMTDPFSFLLTHEDKVNRILRKLKSKNTIDETTFQSMYCSGSKPGIMYGLPKIHKDGCPMRPILSAIGTYNYSIAKHLVPILEPISISEYTVKDSFSFAKELSDLRFRNCVMASFDVQSLFTNIPLSETIDICINELFQNDDEVEGFSRKEMKDLLSLAANDCIFMFNNKFYVQTDGCAMGSPIGPSFANIFLSYYEKIWIQECPIDFKPIHYRRYVDDTFLVFKERDHVPLFLQYLNSKHQNIKFTSEVEKDHSISFLDINITNTGGEFETSVYRKPTFTGLSTKFTSFTPLKYKRNLVATLVYRAFHLCSSYENIHKELNYIKSYLFKNGFPLNFTNTWFGKTLSKLIVPEVKEILTAQRKTITLSMPYVGSHSFNIKKKLVRLIEEFYPQVSLKITLSSKNCVGNFFKFKDKIPEDLRSSVIYLYKCDCCSASYVGKCERHFATRRAEHYGRSVRTGRYFSKPSHSAIRDHSFEHDHLMKKENFSVLASTSGKLDLTIMEALFQHKLKPNLGRPSFELCCV